MPSLGESIHIYTVSRTWYSCGAMSSSAYWYVQLQVMGMFMHVAVLQFLASACGLIWTLQAKPKSGGESAVSTEISLLQKCPCCTTSQSIWQPSVDRVLPSEAQCTQDQDNSAGGAAAWSGGSSIVSEGGWPWGCTYTVVCIEMPGQHNRSYDVERRDGSELGGVWSGVGWPNIVSVLVYWWYFLWTWRLHNVKWECDDEWWTGKDMQLTF